MTAFFKRHIQKKFRKSKEIVAEFAWISIIMKAESLSLVRARGSCALMPGKAERIGAL